MLLGLGSFLDKTLLTGYVNSSCVAVRSPADSYGVSRVQREVRAKLRAILDPGTVRPLAPQRPAGRGVPARMRLAALTTIATLDRMVKRAVGFPRSPRARWLAHPRTQGQSLRPPPRRRRLMLFDANRFVAHRTARRRRLGGGEPIVLDGIRGHLGYVPRRNHRSIERVYGAPHPFGRRDRHARAAPRSARGSPLAHRRIHALARGRTRSFMRYHGASREGTTSSRAHATSTRLPRRSPRAPARQPWTRTRPRAA